MIIKCSVVVAYFTPSTENCFAIHYIFYILIFNRILFPFLSNEDKNLSCYGYCKADESVDSGDPDDYVSIDSG